MQRIFYSSESGSGNAGSGSTSDNSGKQKFPEDPGTQDRRIPDGGGPADGFMDKEGHGSGKGFLGHVEGGDSTRTKAADSEGQEG